MRCCSGSASVLRHADRARATGRSRCAGCSRPRGRASRSESSATDLAGRRACANPARSRRDARRAARSARWASPARPRSASRAGIAPSCRSRSPASFFVHGPPVSIARDASDEVFTATLAQLERAIEAAQQPRRTTRRPLTRPATSRPADAGDDLGEPGADVGVLEQAGLAQPRGADRVDLGGGARRERATRVGARRRRSRARARSPSRPAPRSASPESSPIPSPTSSGTASGLLAISPHTEIGMPARRGRAHAAVDQRQHRRVQRVVEVRDALVAAVHRQRVLREVVGADAEEVALARERVGDQRRRRHLDHDADRHLARRRRSRAAPARPASPRRSRFARRAARRATRSSAAAAARCRRRSRAGSRAAARGTGLRGRARGGSSGSRAAGSPRRRVRGSAPPCRRRGRACGSSPAAAPSRAPRARRAAPARLPSGKPRCASASSSVRNSPMPSAPCARRGAGRASRPTFAESAMRRPSRVSAGPLAQRVEVLERDRVALLRAPVLGEQRARRARGRCGPSPPSTIAISPGRAAAHGCPRRPSRRGSRACARRSRRARSSPPCSATIAATLSISSMREVRRQDHRRRPRSSPRRSGTLRWRTPSSCAITRRPTSSTSSPRSRKYGSSMPLEVLAVGVDARCAAPRRRCRVCGDLALEASRRSPCPRGSGCAC